MAYFPASHPPDVEEALSRLIERQLAQHGVDADPAALVRVRQQLPVSEFLERILELGRRDRGSEPGVLAAAVAAPAPPAPEPPAGTAADSAAADDTPAAAARPVPAALETTPAPQAFPAVADAPAAPAAPPDPVAGTESQARQEAGMRIYRLLVPNATADVKYSHTLDLSKEPLAVYRIAGIEGLERIGLAFDPETGRLHGVPRAEPGQAVQHDLEVILEPHAGTSTRAEARLSLFINPHPRTLWKQLEPDASLEFRKEHRRCHCEAGPPHVLAASVRGRSHENSGAFREDDFHVGQDAGRKWTVVAVSDGAGSAKLSRLGSQIATQASVASLLAALERDEAAIESRLAAIASIEDPQERARQLQAIGEPLLLEPVGRAAFAASRAIQAKATELDVEEKALAATLMFAAIRREGDAVLVASYWIGDGAAALLDPATGLFWLLGEADSGEYSGQTRFLLSPEFPRDGAWASIGRRFRFNCVPVGAVLMMMTDGVSDPKFGTDNALRDPARWLSFWKDDLAAQLPLDESDPELGPKLAEYLQFWSQGEHDDRTLALVRWP